MDLKHLIEKIDFTEETLAAAHFEQASLFLEAGRFRVQKMRERMKVEAVCSSAAVTAAMRVRKNKDEKLTEAAIRERVDSDKEVVEARRGVDEAKAVEEYAKILMEAYHQRASMVKSLVQLTGAQVLTESRFIRDELERMGIKRLREKVRMQFPGAGGNG